MTRNYDIKIAYHLDDYIELGVANPVMVNMALGVNSHCLISGMSGSGKSYFELQLLCRLIKADENARLYFADYKGDDTFDFLHGCQRYYSYHDTLDGFNEVYGIMQKRMSGEDESRNQVTLIWDEYVANILALQERDNKLAKKVMGQVSEVLLLGRSKGVRLICTCQRPDANVFPQGSRLNYGVIVILGAPLKSILEMLLPSSEYIDMTEGRTFKQGEGILLLQSTEMTFIKVPTIRNMDALKTVCMKGLSG